MSPGGSYLLYFDESEADWFTYRIADGVKVNLTDEARPQLLARGSRLAEPAAGLRHRRLDRRTTRRCSSTTSTTSGRSSRTARSARMVTNGDGPQAADRLPLSLARPRAARDSDRQAAAALGQRRQDRGQRLLPRQPDRHRRAREDRDGRQGRSASSSRRRTPTASSSRSRGSTSSRISGSATRSFRDMKKVSNANPQQARVRLGQGRADAVHQRRRQEAARDPRPSRRTSIRRRSIR